MPVRISSLAYHLESGMKRMVMALALSLLAASAVADRMTAPAGAEVYFIAPQNGAKLHGPVTVKFGLKGLGIAPATDKLLHFGKGQTEAVVTLPPGKHTLQLVLGDYTHVAFDPPLISKKITITVE
jgi:Domain of unknown function (DUF4399)